MNDFYAVEPKNFGSADKLKMLLRCFGVYQGRFISAYPPSWEMLVRQSVSGWSEMERKRVSRILEKLTRENVGLIRSSDLPYKSERTWADNVLAVQFSKNSTPFAGGVVEGESPNPFFKSALDFDPEGADGELMTASPENYARVSEVLLMVSQEIYLIDPYLDITRSDIDSVVSGLLSAAKRGKCKRFIIYASRANVSADPDEIKIHAERLLKKSGGPVSEMTINLCNDRGSEGPLHARYLLSIHGALRFDQGFQRLRRKVDVSIVAQRSHLDLEKQFIEVNLPFTFESIIASIKK
jgi:hypothetical protein